MELKLYWKIIYRRWWLTALIIGLVLLTIPFHKNPAPTYHAEMRFLVGVRPEITSPDAYSYDRYYTWRTAEYLIDDLSEVVQGSMFSREVQKQLQASDSTAQLSATAIQGSTQTSKLHRLLKVNVNGPDEQTVQDVASAVTKVLESKTGDFFPEAYARGATVILVDGPHIGVNKPNLRRKLTFPMELLLALLAGLFIEFLLYYLDDRLWEITDVEAMGWKVIATFPPH